MLKAIRVVGLGVIGILSMAGVCLVVFFFAMLVILPIHLFGLAGFLLVLCVPCIVYLGFMIDGLIEDRRN